MSLSCITPDNGSVVWPLLLWSPPAARRDRDSAPHTHITHGHARGHRSHCPAHPNPALTPVTGIYVLGFVIGPLLWAPCSEVFGRRAMFVFTYVPFTAFNAGVCGAKSLNVLLVMRFFAGTFGSSTMTNSG